MKTIFCALLVCASLMNASAQVKTPAAAENAFKQKFPSAQKVSWDKENAHEYEAEFTLNGVKTSANFSDEGKWLETEVDIKVADLPKKVTEAFKAKYPSTEISGASKIETSGNKIRYEAEFKQNGKKQEVLFDADGTVVKN